MSAPTVQPLFAKTILARTIAAYYIRPQPYGIADGDQFDPRLLFTDGVQGAWYDPSDFSSMYQDAAGTTPVTALGQPVGLRLDKRLGLALGSEVITQPVNFLTGWTYTGSPTVTSTSFTTTSTGGVTFPFVAAEGEFFECTATISSDVTVNLFVPTNTTTIAAGSLRTITFLIRIGTGGSTGFYFRNSAAGTTTITSLSIKKILGNHAYQTTAASRGTIEARVNLFTKSEQFNDAAWTRNGITTVVANATTAPDGTLTADKIVEDTVASGHFITQSGVGRFMRVHAKAAERSWLLVYSGVANSNVYVNLSTGAYTALSDVASVVVADKGNGWWQVDVTWTTLSTSPRIYGTTGSGVSSWTGDGVSGIYIWGADLRYSSSEASYPYQQVNTATDYADVGAPRYIKYDGVDDGYVTNSIDFTGTDKVTVWAGVRKLSDAAIGIVAELSGNAASNTGAFYLIAPASAGGASYGFNSRGTASAQAIRTGYTSPHTAILTGQGDISADTSVIRVSGAQSSVSTDQGTGNYGNYPLYLGARAGTSLRFSGHDYGLIIRGAASNAAQIAAGEAFMNSKARAF